VKIARESIFAKMNVDQPNRSSRERYARGLIQL